MKENNIIVEHNYNSKYKKYDIVYTIIEDNKQYFMAIKDVPRFTSILNEDFWKHTEFGEGGGTTDYEQMQNKPSINNVELDGNLTPNELGLQEQLVSGTNIKTINGNSLVGDGNIVIPKGDKGDKGDDAVNPFKGWYDSSSNLPSNPVVGDYAYVKGATASDPAVIYECTTAGSWSDSGRTVDTSNVQSFKSGEFVHNVPIDNSELANPTTNALAKAVDVNEKITPINFAINGNPGTIIYQAIDYSGPNNTTFKASSRKLIPANGRIVYSESYKYDTMYYYKVYNGDNLNIHIPRLGSTMNSATILGLSTNEYPSNNNGGIVKFDEKVSNYGNNYADNNGAGFDIEYKVKKDTLPEETPMWLCICAYGQVTDYTTYNESYIPSVNRKIIYGEEKGLLERVENLEHCIDIDDGKILSLNPEKEIVEKLKAAKFTNNNTYRGITFAHISDYHYSEVTGTENYERFIEFFEHYKFLGLVNDAVDTGDLTDSVTIDEFETAHDQLKALDGFENILLINGNHDTDVIDGIRWYGKIGQPVYNREFRIHAESESTDSWGVTFPSNAATDFTCYYYKDYSVGGNLPSVRAIFLDVMGWNMIQQEWLNDILANAIQNNHHVIIFAHYLTDRRVAVKCSYCRESGEGGEGTGIFNGEMSVNQGTPSAKLIAITNGELHTIAYNVQNFIDNGGVFVGYVCGHRHLNKVGYLKKYPKQWFINITSGKRGEPHDYPDDEKKGKDNFELVTVNTYTKCLTLIKIGGRYNNVGALTNTLGIDYIKGEIVSEGYSNPLRPAQGDNKNRPYMTQDTDYMYQYYDTTYKKPIYWDGKKWIDSNNEVVSDAGTILSPVLERPTNVGNGFQCYWNHNGVTDLIVYYNGAWRFVETNQFVKDGQGASYTSISNPQNGFQFWDTNDLCLYVYDNGWIIRRY